MNDRFVVHLPESFTEKSYGEVFELIDHTSKNLGQIRRLTVAEAGLTPPQYRVLHLLWQQDRRPFKDLAEACACTRATITGLIDILERKELVVRVQNPNDRRSLLATLTEKGRQMQNETPSLEHTYDRCCTGLAPHELQQLGLLLEKLNASLNC